MLQKFTKRRELLTAAMLLCFCAFTNNTMAQTWNIGNPGYNANVKATLSGNTLTISGSGNMVDFWDSSEGEAPWWFNTTHRNAIQTVIIQSNVTNIGNRAFKDCGNLRTVRIESPVYIIGRQAFFNCTNTNFTEITIPNSVTEIEGEAFKGCSNLKTVNIENGTAELKFSHFYYNGSEYPRGDKTDWFYGCPLQTLHFGRNLSPSSISINPFPGTSIQTLTIGNTVTKIGGSAFLECGELTSISIPKSVTLIESGAFENCRKLKNLTLEDGPQTLSIASASYYGAYNAFNGCPITNLYVGRNLEVVNGNYYQTFRDKTTLTSVTISEGVITLGRYAFAGCVNLMSVSIPNSFTTIESYMFYNCSNLKSIIIPSTIISIKDYAFSECGELTNISIPKSVTLIESSAFENCRKLKNLTLEDGPQTLSIASASYYGAYNAFNGCPIADLYIGRNLEIVNANYYRTFKDKITLTKLTIGEEVSSIGSYAFSGCVNLAEINSKNSTPPTADNYCFDGVNKTTCKLTVPTGSINAYKIANEWKDFFGTNGIDNVVANQLQIFPNPAKNDIFIKSDLQIEKVEIYSLTGALLILENNFNEKLFVSDLSEGVYLLKVHTDKGLAVSKIVKE